MRGIRIYVIKVIIAVVISVIALLLPITDIVQMGILLIAYVIAGFDVIKNAFKKLAKLQLANEDFLMTVATVGAIALGEYTEAIAVMVFYGIGEILEQLAVANSKKSITDLMNIKPVFANVIRSGQELKVAPNEVSVGETIIVKVGEKIPLDGVVTKGMSSLDTSSLTGES
ncbi:MAG: heavy metal translocating P-type ATPase, partial [Niameybacter sp.]